ncbi:MAG: DUF4349 domain-containing protein [Oscillospiraceae bacterium]|nr:DUF4349 domain-containing protein [Oscillospiraceae bacterium]
MKKLILFLCLISIGISLAGCSSKMAGKSDGIVREEIFEENNGATTDIIATSEKGVKKNIKSDLDKRKLIKNVTMIIQTKSFDEFIESLETEIDSRGGFIQKSDITGKGFDDFNTYRRATIVVRIPAEKLDDFTGKVSSLGNVKEKSENVEDVTMDYVDVESRIKALKVEQQSLLELLEKADNLKDILTIQDHLANVRSELESYEAKMRTYDDLIAYSAVTMEIIEVERVIQSNPENIWQEIGNKLSDNIYNISKAGRSFFVWFVGNSPYFAIIAVIVVVIIIIIRIATKKSRRKAPPFPPQTPQSGNQL